MTAPDDDAPPLPKPDLLPSQPVPPAVTAVIRDELPTVLGWLGEIRHVDVDGVPPFDIGKALAGDQPAPAPTSRKSEPS